MAKDTLKKKGKPSAPSRSGFRVLKPKSALAALKAADRKTPLFEGWDEIHQQIAEARTLGSALTACCWDIERDSDGKIDKLFYEGKLLTDFEAVERLFRLLAPFVRTGSFMIIEGEDGAGWRFDFAKGKLRILEED